MDITSILIGMTIGFVTGCIYVSILAHRYIIKKGFKSPFSK